MQSLRSCYPAASKTRENEALPDTLSIFRVAASYSESDLQRVLQVCSTDALPKTLLFAIANTCIYSHQRTFKKPAQKREQM